MGASLILFDFGGVLWEIDTFAPTRKMAQIAPPKYDWNSSKWRGVIEKLDEGKLSPEEYINTWNEIEGYRYDPKFLLDAWKSVLIGMYPGRQEIMNWLKSNGFQISLLSNTNKVHTEIFLPQCQDLFKEVSPLFLSCEMGLSKPHKEIYEAVLDKLRVPAQEILFVDDTEDNIRVAEELGFQGLHLTKPLELKSELQKKLGC